MRWHRTTGRPCAPEYLEVPGLVLRTIPERRRLWSDQILPGDDLAKPRIVGDEFLDEFVDAVLENVVHVAVLEAVADATRVALRGSLAAIGDADLVEVAREIAVTARQRPRQRIVEDQQVRDQPGFQCLAIDPVIGR